LNEITDAGHAGAPAGGVEHDDVVVPAVRDTAADQLQRSLRVAAGLEYPGLVAEPGGGAPGVQRMPVGAADGEEESVALQRAVRPAVLERR
jgi:hypothetical protein